LIIAKENIMSIKIFKELFEDNLQFAVIQLQNGNPKHIEHQIQMVGMPAVWKHAGHILKNYGYTLTENAVEPEFEVEDDDDNS